jgi:hypothetical protein
MMGRGYYLQRRIDARYQQRGSQITLRRVSFLSGNNTLPNPAMLKNLTVAQDAAQGDVTVSLSATVARGRLVPGDQLVMGNVTATVAQLQVNDITLESGTVLFAENGDQITLDGSFSSYDLPPLLTDTPAVNNAFPQVLLTEPLSGPVSAGTQVTMVWQADTTVYGYINSYDNTMIDGQRIQANDLQVGISALSANPAAPPTITDKIVVLGVEKAILNVSSKINDNQQLVWVCQVR